MRRGGGWSARTRCGSGFLGSWGAGVAGICGPRLPRWRADDVFVERWSWAMGQPVHVMVFAGSEQEGLDACAAALAELRRVEGPPTRTGEHTSEIHSQTKNLCRPLLLKKKKNIVESGRRERR